MSVLDEIESVLSSMLRITGLTGAIFTDSPGDIISAKMPENYRIDPQKRFVATVLDLKSNLEELDFHFSELTYSYTENRIVFYDLQCGNLFILCRSSISRPFLHLSIKVPCKKLINIMKQLN